MHELCLNLLCQTAMEETVLDLLLMAPEVISFTSTPTAAHGLPASEMEAREQVLGRAAATLVLVEFKADQQDALLARLGQQLRGSGVRYWVTPILAQGVFA